MRNNTVLYVIIGIMGAAMCALVALSVYAARMPRLVEPYRGGVVYRTEGEAVEAVIGWLRKEGYKAGFVNPVCVLYHTSELREDGTYLVHALHPDVETNIPERCVNL